MGPVLIPLSTKGSFLCSFPPSLFSHLLPITPCFAEAKSSQGAMWTGFKSSYYRFQPRDLEQITQFLRFYFLIWTMVKFTLTSWGFVKNGKHFFAKSIWLTVNAPYCVCHGCRRPLLPAWGDPASGCHSCYQTFSSSTLFGYLLQ